MRNAVLNAGNGWTGKPVEMRVLRHGTLQSHLFLNESHLFSKPTTGQGWSRMSVDEKWRIRENVRAVMA